MLTVNSNISALASQGSLTTNARGLASVMEQLSTGKRINSAVDDVAGLSISSRLTTQIKGLGQAIRNGNDAISLVQTVDGAAQSIVSMLQRIRELSIQHSNDTNNSTDRQSLSSEMFSLSSEISRIVDNTEWNGMKLFSGLSGSDNRKFGFEIGANGTAGDTIHVEIPNLNVPPELKNTPITTTTTAPVTTYTTTPVTTTTVNPHPFTAANITNPATQFLWDPANGGNGHIYEWVANQVISWDQARSAAAAQSINGNAGYLTTITSQAELDFIENNVLPNGQNTDNTWIGGHLVTGSTTKWEWTGGPEAGTILWDNGPIQGQFANWNTSFGYPRIGTGATDEPAMGINSYFRPQFDDISSGQSTDGYVVEYSRPPSTTTTTTNVTTATTTLSTSTTTTMNSTISTDAVDAYLNTVMGVRETLGASISRLNSSVDDLISRSTNLQTARSRIEDTDYSKATTELAKRNIIQQASQAMLAQANQEPQGVLQLLRMFNEK